MVTFAISILYVKNVIQSADFYEKILGCAPVEKAPTFVLFVLENGSKLGLWARYTVEPAVSTTAVPTATTELVFTVANPAAVDAYYDEWGVQHQLTVIQKPTDLDFGYTFAVIDPDGHRLRVCFLPDNG